MAEASAARELVSGSAMIFTIASKMLWIMKYSSSVLALRLSVAVWITLMSCNTMALFFTGVENRNQKFRKVFFSSFVVFFFFFKIEKGQKGLKEVRVCGGGWVRDLRVTVCRFRSWSRLSMKPLKVDPAISMPVRRLIMSIPKLWNFFLKIPLKRTHRVCQHKTKFESFFVDSKERQFARFFETHKPRWRGSL